MWPELLSSLPPADGPCEVFGGWEALSPRQVLGPGLRDLFPLSLAWDLSVREGGVLSPGCMTGHMPLGGRSLDLAPKKAVWGHGARSPWSWAPVLIPPRLPAWWRAQQTPPGHQVSQVSLQVLG